MKKLLFIFLVSFFFTKMSNAQIPIWSERNYTIIETIYSANAQELSSDWISEDFSLDEQGRYSTGSYSPNVSLLTQSNPIKFPALEENQKIILQLKGDYRTEYIYDRILISISTDGGENFKEIAWKSGQGLGWDEDFDLSEFAGKIVMLSLTLISDDRHEDEGITLDFAHVFMVQVPYLSSLRTGNSERNDLRLQPSLITLGFDQSPVYDNKPVYIGVNIENLPNNVDKKNAEVYVYIAAANSSDFTKYKVDYKADPNYYGDYYIEVPSSFILKPYFKYYFEAQIPGMEELLIYPNAPFTARTVAIYNNFPPLVIDGPAGIGAHCTSWYLWKETSFSSQNPIIIKRLYYRELGSNDPYLYIDLLETDKIKEYYIFSESPSLLDFLNDYDYYTEIPKINNYVALEFFVYMETSDGTQGIRHQGARPEQQDDDYNYIGHVDGSTLLESNCGESLTRTYKIISGPLRQCRDVIVSNITSSNEHFSVSPLESNITLGYSDIVGYYNEFFFDVTYDGLANTTSTITIFSDATNKSEYTFEITGKAVNCCPTITLSNNPINSQSHTLSFNLLIDSQTSIYLTDDSGNKMTTIPHILNEALEAGAHEVSLENLFQYNLDPLTPYILVIETDQEKSLTYLYISKL